MKITYGQYRETRQELLELFGSFGSFDFMLDNYSRQRKGDWQELMQRQHDIALKTSDALNRLETLILQSEVKIDFEDESLYFNPTS